METPLMSTRVEVSQLNQLKPGQRKLVKVNGQQIALFNLNGAIYAINNTCPHSRGPLIKGRIYGTKVTCPWHGAQFDITTGQCQNGPATTNIIAYSTYIEGDAVFVEIT